MSILIKMDMPENCAECQLLEGDTMDGICHAANKWLDDDYFRWARYDDGDIDDSKPLNCPLVEVPPHGDLIDRTRLYEQTAKWEASALAEVERINQTPYDEMDEENLWVAGEWDALLGHKI